MAKGVTLVWATPDAGQVIIDTARVSNTANQGKPGGKLLKYLLDHNHVSPFEMASACFEIQTTRDISRQVLRHRSFSYQEFSQRYAEAPPNPIWREARLQDPKNRQNSIEAGDNALAEEFFKLQKEVWDMCSKNYQKALDIGIAKEQARVMLPEGLTPTLMYMTGTIRSWIHYVAVRQGNGTQKEHTLVAKEVKRELLKLIPELDYYFRSLDENSSDS